MINNELIIKKLTDAEYQQTHDAMLVRTLERIAQYKQGIATPDELWIVEHQDVYTLGIAGKEEHILERSDTPVIKTDRGGQVTWHGKGQLVIYWLFDLTALTWKVRDLVSHAEQAIEDVVNHCINNTSNNISASRIIAKARQDAPGVYLYQQQDVTINHVESSNVASSNDATKATEMIGKIASLGFKIKHGFSYHGIALNLTCDLTPFSMINPCGYAGMQMIRLKDHGDYYSINDHDDNENSSDCHDDVNVSDEITNMLIRNISLRHGNVTQLRNHSNL